MKLLKIERSAIMVKKKDLKAEIIRAALKAFAKSDYQKVSTNQIVEEAKVSKGLLFHYFKSKMSLYTYLYEMAWAVVHRDIFTDFPFENRDVFERLRLMMLRKTKSFHNHQTLSAFLKQVHLSKMPEVVKLRVQTYQTFQQKTYRRLFEKIDTTLFRDDLYIDEIYKVVTLTLNKLAHECEKQHGDKDNAELLHILEDELNHYTVFFKHYFYG